MKSRRKRTEETDLSLMARSIVERAIGSPLIVDDKTTANWSPWRAVPDPRRLESLLAPLGPGCYELRRKDTEEKVLFGVSKNVAARMTSLLPKRLGTGTRKNSAKQEYVLQHIGLIKYRTIACADRHEAANVERELATRGPYLFNS